MFIKACFIDEHLLANAFYKKKWQIHSKYKNSFNLQEKEKNEILVVTTTNYSLMPNGIYVKKKDFEKLTQNITNNQPIILEENRLFFASTSVLLNQAKSYSTKLELSNKLTHTSMDFFLNYSKNLEKQTGIQLSLNQFYEKQNPFKKALYQACSENSNQQLLGIQFLLGRGAGLTPSGDDMLVGHLAARIGFQKNSRNMKRVLTQFLLTERPLTTDISKHYLLCGLSGRFSKPVQKLTKLLTEKNNEEQIKAAVKEIAHFGHTSGIDFLAGFLVTMKYFKEK